MRKIDKIVDFLIAVGKLKEKKRRGWLLHRIKNPETTASHSFRLAILAWVLCRRDKNFNLERILKTALIHDICEVHTWGETPYDPILPRDEKEQKKILSRWPDFTPAQRKKKALNKYKREHKSLEKLVSELPVDLKREMLRLWNGFEQGLSKEGRFVNQADKIENYLQGMEYWNRCGKIHAKLWTRWIEEVCDDPVLFNFLEGIKKRFYKKEKKISGELDFLLKLGKLKEMVRRGWILREIKDGSTVAEDAFLQAIAVWVLNGGEKKLNLEKMLKMSLIFEICEVYAKDRTPYEKILPKNKLARKKVLERWPRFPESVKRKRFIEDYKEEKKSLERLCSKLPGDLTEEIIYLWDDCKRKRTPEGNFVNQICWVTMMMQALQYWEKDKSFPIIGWVEQMKEFIDDPTALEYLNALYRKYP